MSTTNNNLKTDPPSSKQSWYKSPWLIGWLLLLLTVMAVNGYMISQSFTDFPGLVVDDFYDRGQNYEENIHKKLENNQKWTTQFQLVDMHMNKATTINFTINGKEGKPAEVEQITLFAYRPSDAKKDFSVPMKLIDNNTYQANITFNSKGNWDLLASAVIAGTEVNYAKKIFVKD